MLMDTGDLIITSVQPGNAVNIQTLLLFSSWYLILDTGDLLVTGVQI